MPRGFLIKRKKHHAETWFSRRGSEDSEHLSEYGSDSRVSSSHSDEALNLSTKDNNVFNEGLDLTTSRSNSSDNESQESSEKMMIIKPDDSILKEKTEVNLNKIYLEATKKAQLLVEKEKLSQEEFNNNFIPSHRHPLSDFNRETLKHFISNSLPSSMPLSISTGTSLSPFYMAAFDHLSVASSPTSSSSHGSSPKNAPPSTDLASDSSPSEKSLAKKRTHPTNQQKTVPKSGKKAKAVRKVDFSDSSSPVSGTYIREETEEGIRVVSGDIDTNLNIVEVTPEAEAEIAKIDNKIGDYKCRLCKDMFETAFTLAQHRCSRIVHVEYRCPECDKVFNCSANLASHRRWHKPRQPTQAKLPLPKLLPNGLPSDPSATLKVRGEEQGQFPCNQCGKQFKRQAYLRKHMATHAPSSGQQQQQQQQQPQQQQPQQQQQESERPYPCHLCGTILSSETARAKHVMQHASDRLLVCRVCGTHVPDRLALEDHIRHHHSGGFACKLCSSSFFSLPSLSEHVRKCHSSTQSHHPLVMLQIPPLSRPC